MIIDDLKEIVKKVAPKTNPDLFNEDARLSEDLKLDSLTVLMVSMEIEKYYNIHLDNDLPVFKTVKEVIEYLKKFGIQD